MGTSEVPVNPSEDNPPSKAPALSIPSKSFSLSGFSGVGRVKTYGLVIRVHTESDENCEPAKKKRKGEDEVEEDNEEAEGRVVSAELVVYDKHSRCLLTEGEYELVMAEEESGRNRKSPSKSASWEIIDVEPGSSIDGNSANQFNVFSSSPTLKFRLSWSSEQAGPMVERPRPLMARDNAQDAAYLRRDKPATNGKQSNGRTKASNGSNKTGEKPTRIVYQFLYNNNSRQQTEAREDLHCPWCSLNCLTLYGLLKHLKLSHPRFLFTYVVSVVRVTCLLFMLRLETIWPGQVSTESTSFLSTCIASKAFKGIC